MQAAAGVELEQPNQLVDSGPDAFSRNPMCLAWTIGYVGVALVAGTTGPLVLLPVVLAVTEVVVMREERSLEQGSEMCTVATSPRSADTCRQGGLPEAHLAHIGMINEASSAAGGRTLHAL